MTQFNMMTIWAFSTTTTKAFITSSNKYTSNSRVCIYTEKLQRRTRFWCFVDCVGGCLRHAQPRNHSVIALLKQSEAFPDYIVHIYDDVTVLSKIGTSISNSDVTQQ